MNFRHYPLFIDNRKFAEMYGVAYSMDSGVELQFDIVEGIAGASFGVMQIKIEADYVQPVKGTSVNVVHLFLNHIEFSTRINVGGDAHACDGVFASLAYNSQSKSGTATGKATFLGTTAPIIFPLGGALARR